MFSVASTLTAYRQRLLGVAVALLALGLLGAGAGLERLGRDHAGLPASDHAAAPPHVAGNAPHAAGKSHAASHHAADAPPRAVDHESSPPEPQAPAADHTTAAWLTSIVTAEPPGVAPQWRVPPLRPLPAFGDSTWNSAAADQSPAVTLTLRRRDQGESTRRLALLWASLQAWKIRLQI